MSKSESAAVEVWTIQATERGDGYSIVSPDGECFGSYADQQSGRAHHAMALAESVRLKKALSMCLHVIEKGIEVRIGDQWPAIAKLLPDAASQARKVLYYQDR